MRHGIGRLAIASLAACAGLAATLPDEGGGTRRQGPLDHGRFLYAVYCGSCHGETGRGDGPTAEVLKVAPADLTRLSRDNGGAFPFEEVYRVIDGRTDVRGHGGGRMPIWGLTFQEWDEDSNQEREVRGKILQLLRYLESLQSVEGR